MQQILDVVQGLLDRLVAAAVELEYRAVFMAGTALCRALLGGLHGRSGEYDGAGEHDDA
ncbi:MAG: hypothetical protein P8011_19765 [Acidihalobacter sp.]